MPKGISTADNLHLSATVPEGAKLAGGVYSIQRSTLYPSYIELDVQH